MKFRLLTIRSRLLSLTLGLAIPLILVGFYNLWNFWQTSRTQMDESLTQQAELAANALEQRLVAHRQTLETIAMLVNSGERNFTLQEYLDFVVRTRPEWLDVQIINENGEKILAQSIETLNLPADPNTEIKNEAEQKKTFFVSTEQTADKKMRLLSLAMPVANRGLIVARINAASANDVFENLALPEDNRIVVFDKNNRLFYRNRVTPEQMSLDLSETALFTALKEKREGTIEVESPYDRVRRVYGLARVETGDWVVAVAVPSASLYEPARRQFIRHLLFSLPIAALAIFAAYVIARSIDQPMRLLTNAARAFGAGDLRARTDVTQSGAIRELGVTFNQMAEKIAQREEELKALDRLKSEFVSSVSHELRTPLTTIKTLVRVLQRDNVSPEEREEFLETIAAECDRQIDFVQNLLDLSRIESGAYKIALSPTDVVKILWECVETQQRTAISQRVSLRFKPPPGDLPPALTDPGALRQVVANLIENAIKYTPEDGQVTIAASRKDERIAVEISDNGCGIAAEDLPYVFDKFYRGQPLVHSNLKKNGEEISGEVDCYKANEAPGVGLGLYLVRNLAEQIGAEITAESPVDEKTRGAKFTVFLPEAK